LDKRPDTVSEGLSQRKRDLLRRVINHYVREVHPVSSKVLASEVHISSATVRNELASLEQLGYLHQLHTSGGRVPTDRAYRFLVEELIHQLVDTISQRARVSEVYRQLGHEVEVLLEGTLDLLTEMTGYVAWVSIPTPSALEIRSVNFVEIDARELLVVLVTGTGVIQSTHLTVNVPVRELSLGRLTDALNTYLRNRSVIDVDYAELKRILHETVAVPDSILATLQDFFLSLAGSGDRLLFSNALRLALEPEFSRAESLGNVLNAIDDKERFVHMLRKQLSDRRVQTIIGTENVDSDLHECSLVLSRYGTPDSGDGTLGVLGPTRLLYARTLPWVKVIGEAVAQALVEIAGGKVST
jgi:heat-inducible transcriptional repressor